MYITMQTSIRSPFILLISDLEGLESVSNLHTEKKPSHTHLNLSFHSRATNLREQNTRMCTSKDPHFSLFTLADEPIRMSGPHHRSYPGRNWSGAYFFHTRRFQASGSQTAEILKSPRSARREIVELFRRLIAIRFRTGISWGGKSRVRGWIHGVGEGAGGDGRGTVVEPLSIASNYGRVY